jgi:phosphate transport system substrate-binding protein
MKSYHRKGIFGFMILLTLIIVSAIGLAKAPEQLSGNILIDGSSTVFPITEAVAEEFQKKYPGVRVSVGISGTGGGFKKFTAKETDISDASRPIKTSEADDAAKNGVEYIELAIAYDGLSVMVNPKNTWVKELTVADLKKIWEPAAQGKITRWNQVRPEWPNEEIHLYGPGTDSGTFDYFTEAINGKALASRGDFTASEDDNVLVQGIAGDRFGLGYFGYAYYVENKSKLKLIPIVNPNTGKAVLPSEKTINDASYQPLSRPIFIYVSKQAAVRPEVQEFVRFYLTQSPKLVKEVGYVALPNKFYQEFLKRFEARKTGSLFSGGPQVGVTLDDLLKKAQ